MIKATLTSGKVVMLREYKLRDREAGIRAVGNRAGDSQFLFSELIQKEMTKILVAQVDGKAVSASEIEDLDKFFTPAEFAELGKVLTKVMGVDALAGEPLIEFEASGG